MVSRDSLHFNGTIFVSPEYSSELDIQTIAGCTQANGCLCILDLRCLFRVMRCLEPFSQRLYYAQ